MKLTRGALSFLLAEYRSIFKKAYFKGLASAVVLTAGLAAGQANADYYYLDSGSSTWKIGNATSLSVESGHIVAAGLAGDNLNAIDVSDGVIAGDNSVDGATLVIGSGDNNIQIMSGSAVGAWITHSGGAMPLLQTTRFLFTARAVLINLVLVALHCAAPASQ